MAYGEQREIQVLDTVLTTSTGVKGALAAGVNPYVLRRVGVLVTVVPTVTPTVITVKRSSRSAAYAALSPSCTITIPTTAVLGQVYWSETALNVVVTPGDRIGFDVTTASTAGSVSLVAVVDPSYDSPGNDTDLVKVVA